MKKIQTPLYLIVLITISILVNGCSGGGKGAAAVDLSKTTVSGKVMLSGTIASGKPGAYAFTLGLKASRASSGNPAAQFAPGGEMRKSLAAGGVTTPPPLSSATVELYDADHPEWVYPVAIALSDAQGNYLLNTLANATENNAPYANGEPIPGGNYSIIASKYDANVGKLFVAVQAVVKKFEGPVTGNDLQAPDSDAVPKVAFMFGRSKNADGSFGNTSILIPRNSAIPITFNMPMARLRAIESITVYNAASGATVEGIFKISPDLLTVTFHPASALTEGEVYAVRVLGGKAPNAAKSVYGIPITANVTGKFTASSADITPPTVYPISPAITTDVAIVTPIRIASTEPLDVNTFTVASSPGIGDKPFIRYVGLYQLTIQSTTIDSFVYEIVPSIPLQVNSTYSIRVSDARDMAGNPLPSTPITFTTEASSTGIISADLAKRLAVKDVFGKWINALNSRNTALLTTYMTGNFYWLTGQNSHDDLNRDGRLNVNEFSTMLENLFPALDRCSTTVTGDIVDDAGPGSGISINGSNATIKFNLTMTSSNTTDPSCVQEPPQIKYAELQNINGAWLLTNGSDTAVSEFPPSLRTIELIAPTNGTFYPEPTQAEPLLPEFSWLGVPDVKAYALVIIDVNSKGWQDGWVGIVDGAGTADNIVKAKYNPNPGPHGNVYVLGPRPAFGFRNNLQFKPGGSYVWAVLGFKTFDVTLLGNGYSYEVVHDLAASSASLNFSTLGIWKDLTVTIKDNAGNSYGYSEYLDGFNVGSASTITLTVMSPDNRSSVVQGSYYISGKQTWQNGTLTFNSQGVATTTVTLSGKQNWVQVSDGISLYKQFSVYTTGGTPPKIRFDQIIGYDCNGDQLTNFPTDPWGHYNSNDVCTIDINGHVTDLAIANVIVYVNSDNGWFNNTSSPVTVNSGFFSITGIPIFHGWNRVEVYDPNNYTNVNDISVNTGAGSRMPSGVTVTSVLCSQTTGTVSANKISESIGYSNESYWDAGSAGSISMSGIIKPDPVNGFSYFTPNYNHYVPPMWIAQSNGNVALTNAVTGDFTQSINLVRGWNVVQISGPLGSTRMYVHTTGGSLVTSPHVIANISDPVNTSGSTPAVTSGYTSYDAGAACSITIAGESTNSGNAYLYFYGTDSKGQNYYEYIDNIPTTLSNGKYSYTVTKTVYLGTNTIDIYDGSWVWRGLQVTTTCPNQPVPLSVAAVNDGANDLVRSSSGWYGTTSQLVTIRGIAKAGKVISAYISSGSSTNTKTATAYTGDQYTMDIPLQPGYNYINLSDGNTTAYVYILCANGTAYVSAINSVRLDGALASSGGTSTDNWGNWSTTNTNVTVSGIAVKKDLNGAFVHKGSYNSHTGSLMIDPSTGSFSFPLALDNGLNYVTLSDSEGRTFYMTITTSGGLAAPQQLVFISTPSDGGVVSGSFPVSGTVDLTNFGAAVGTVYAYVYDYYTNRTTYYSSSSADVTNLGYKPLTFDTGGSFLFQATVQSTSYKAQIQVYAYDTTGTLSHGVSIMLNPAGSPSVTGGSGYFKPGSTSSDVFTTQTGIIRMILKK